MRTARALAAAVVLVLPGCSPAAVSALSAGRTALCAPAADSALVLIKRKLAEEAEAKKAP